MADVSVFASVGGNTRRCVLKDVWVTASIGYQFFHDSANLIKYVKTTDGGATYGSAVQVSNAAEVNLCFGIWFDKWTAGNSGTLIHITWLGSSVDDLLYRNLDTNGDTLGTQRLVFAGATFVSNIGVHCSITRARGGNLLISYMGDAGAEFGLFRSTDVGVNWTSRTSPFLASPTGDWTWLFPANVADSQDVWLLYLDSSTGFLTLVQHDDSANTNASSATIATIVENATTLTGEFPLSAMVRHSDGHLLLAAITERDTATADHRTFDINGTGSITEKGAVTTNIDDHYYVGMYIDQVTDDVYLCYLGKRDGTSTLITSVNVFYCKSTDDMASWSAGDTAYREAGVGSIPHCWTAPSGPRFYVTWEFGGNLEGNKVNSLDLTGGQSFSYTAVGGMVLGGASAKIAKATRAGVGGFTLAGAAGRISKAVRAALGGLTLGGASTKIAKASRTASGGLQFSGTSDYDTFVAGGTQSFEYVAVGGLTLGGASEKTAKAVRSGVGGIVFAGVAGFDTFTGAQSFEYVAVGGISFNGAAGYDIFQEAVPPPLPEPLPAPEIFTAATPPGGTVNTRKILDLLMARLGNKTSPALRANCLVEMSLIQETDLEGAELLPWFLIGEGAIAVTVPGERRLMLPSDFIREIEDDNLYLVNEDGTYTDIRKVGYDEGRFELGLNPEQGPPTLYSVRGNYILLRPTPDAEYSIRFPSYYARQPLPVDATDDQNAWFRWVPDLLLAKTGVIIAGEYLKDTELVTLFGAQQQRAVKRLENVETAREESNRSRRMG